MKIWKMSKYEDFSIEKYEEGNCFKNVITWITRNDTDVIVVHGKVNDMNGRIIDHAWLENGDRVIDPTVGVNVDKTKYYSITKAVAESKYTSEQALINALRVGNGGPWTKEEVGERCII